MAWKIGMTLIIIIAISMRLNNVIVATINKLFTNTSLNNYLVVLYTYEKWFLLTRYSFNIFSVFSKILSCSLTCNNLNSANANSYPEKK